MQINDMVVGKRRWEERERESERVWGIKAGAGVYSINSNNI